MVFKFITKIFSLVKKELDGWQELASQIPDLELRNQALASIQNKRFHVQGGSIYALYPHTNPENTVKFIVALQTISDYLDNLCDRVGVIDETAFFQLHLAMADAVGSQPISDEHDYYRFYPYKNDGGYLRSLVDVCRKQTHYQVNFHLVQPVILKYIQWYSALQSYKHLVLDIQLRLHQWALTNFDLSLDVHWWEYAAAAGSTLGMFLLFAAAADATLRPETVKTIERSYFPWITGLHILLDYYIDAAEDRMMGDFNFTSQYSSLEECRKRLGFFCQEAVTSCRILPYPSFHRSVIQGLLAMYLSDPKAVTEELKETSLSLVRQGGIKGGVYHGCCGLLRQAGII